MNLFHKDQNNGCGLISHLRARCHATAEAVLIWVDSAATWGHGAIWAQAAIWDHIWSMALQLWSLGWCLWLLLPPRAPQMPRVW